MASGLSVNLYKKKFIDLNLKQGFLEAALTFLAYHIDIVSFQLLGILVGANPRRNSTWRLMLDKLRNQLSKWNSKYLFIGGRMTLLNSLLNSVPMGGQCMDLGCEA